MEDSKLVKNQKRKFGPVNFQDGKHKYQITAEVRHDDGCGNGHNSFSITAEIYLCDVSGKPVRWDSCGCLHEDVSKHFPELAPLVKWHLCSTDGPMHYIANTIYQAGERDHHGLLKGEFRQFTQKDSGLPLWELDLEKGYTFLSQNTASKEKPAPLTVAWKPMGRTGEGKARELAHARSSAIWPEATDAELMQEPETLKAALEARLPALMTEFRKAVESLGFIY